VFFHCLVCGLKNCGKIVETFSLYFATHWALEILVEKVSAFYSTELDFFL
jgi:hypothetical protein